MKFAKRPYSPYVKAGSWRMQRQVHRDDCETHLAYYGDQPLRDRAVNAGITFENARDYIAAHFYYDDCRSRTYACSFSLENSDLIWQRYGEGDPVGGICVVFDFGRLKTVLNETTRSLSAHGRR